MCRTLIISNLSKVPIVDHLIGPSSVVDVEVEESFHESATRETSLPVVDIGDIVLIEVSKEQNIFKEFGAAASGNHNLAGNGLSDECGVEVSELASHIHQAVGVAKPIIMITINIQANLIVEIPFIIRPLSFFIYQILIKKLYLLEEGSKVAGEASGLVNEQLVEVAIIEKSLDISNEVVIEVDSVDHGVKALAESVVVVLKTNNAAEEGGFPRLGVDCSIINTDKSGFLLSAGCGIIIWFGALGLDTVCTTAHGVSEVSKTVSVLTV